MQQLSMTDAFMLAAETDRQKLQMASVSILAPPANNRQRLTRKRLHEHIAKRIDLAPMLRRKLMHVPLGLDFPYWVDAHDLDLDYHIRATKLSSPAGDEELAAAVSQIVSEPFDHSHPLWQLHLIEGLTGDRSALVFKLHHASVDGISGIELHWVVFDPSPETRRMPPAAARTAPPIAPSTATMLTNAITALPGQALRAIVSTARSLPYLDHLMPYRVTPGVPTVAAASRRILGLLPGDYKPVVLEGTALRVPATVFDRPVSGQRRWAFARLSLESARKLKHHFGITLNDVIVATMAGAVRSWLLESQELPDEPLVAVVPISVRCEDAAFGGNEVQVMLIELPTDEPDAQRRLIRAHEALRSAKERHNAVPVAAMRAANDMLMPALFIRASRAAMLLTGLRGPSANLIVSNVPGPTKPVYVAGTQVEALYPVGGVVGGFGLSTIVFSYCDALQFGFVVDANCPADPWRLADACEREQKELLSLLPSLG